MGESGLTASDVALLSDKNGSAWGESSFLWIFALLILANGGFGGWGNNNFANAIGYENLATSNEVQRGFDNQNSMANQRDILAAVNAGTAQAVAATNQVFHDTVDYVGDKYNELARDIAGLAVGQANALANQNQCCCSTKMLIAEKAADTSAQIAASKYDTSMQMAQMEARLSAKMDANEIQSLRDQLNEVRLQQALGGVVRYPNASTYYAGANPFCNCGNGCGGYNI